MRENRLTETLLQYWLERREGRQFPPEGSINPVDLEDIWNSCFLIEVGSTFGGEGYKYTYMGKNLIDAYGEDLSQEEITIMVSPIAKAMIAKLDEVVAEKIPVSDESEFENKDKVHIKFRQVLLPLGHTDDMVEYVLGGMKWKAF